MLMINVRRPFIPVSQNVLGMRRRHLPASLAWLINFDTCDMTLPSHMNILQDYVAWIGGAMHNLAGPLKLYYQNQLTSAN